jgi:hypothetical protein
MAIAGLLLTAIIITLWLWDRPSEAGGADHATSTEKRINAALAFARDACLAEPTLSRQSDDASAAAEARISGLLKGKANVTKEELRIIVDQAIPAEDRAGQYDNIRECIRDRVLLYLSNGSEKIILDQTSTSKPESTPSTATELSNRLPSNQPEGKSTPAAMAPAAAETALQAPMPELPRGQDTLIWLSYSSIWSFVNLEVKINGKAVGVFEEGQGPVCIPLLAKNVTPGDTWEVWGLIAPKDSFQGNMWPSGSGKFGSTVGQNNVIQIGRKMADGSYSVNLVRGKPMDYGGGC